MQSQSSNLQSSGVSFLVSAQPAYWILHLRFSRSWIAASINYTGLFKQSKTPPSLDLEYNNPDLSVSWIKFAFEVLPVKIKTPRLPK